MPSRHHNADDLVRADPIWIVRPALSRCHHGFWACLIMLAAALSGCTPLSRLSLDGVRLSVTADEAAATPTAQQVAANPHAQISVDTGNGAAVLVLGAIDDGREAWYSGDGRIVYLRNGVLEGSAGLAENAAAIRVDSGDIPFESVAATGQPIRIRREYDWMPGYRYGVPVDGELQRLEASTLDVLGVSHNVVHFREHLTGPGVDAINEYWVELASGIVWRSRQMLTPERSLEIVQLKPYSPEPH